MNIIVAHSQGGEVTGSIDESVRHSITKLAYIFQTKKSFDRLIRLGEERKKFCLRMSCYGFRKKENNRNLY